MYIIFQQYGKLLLLISNLLLYLAILTD